MRIAIVLMIVLALWPERARAQDAEIIWVSAGPGCQIERELPWYHARRAGAAACAWIADLKAAVNSERGYEIGATLFIVGNVITFSFPVWAALGADVQTVAAVIIVGEVIDIVGIFIMGEQAFQDLKGAMRAMADEWGDRIDRWRDQINRWGGQIDRLRRSSPAWS